MKLMEQKWLVDGIIILFIVVTFGTMILLWGLPYGEYEEKTVEVSEVQVRGNQLTMTNGDKIQLRKRDMEKIRVGDTLTYRLYENGGIQGLTIVGEGNSP